MRAFVLIGAAIVGVGGLLYAGTGSYVDERVPDLGTVEKALELLSKGERAGYDVLAERFPTKEAGPKQFDAHIRLLNTQLATFGEPCGVELVGAKGVGSSMRRYTYLCKYEEGRIRWQFSFYRPKDEWQLMGVWFDNDDNAIYLTSGSELPPPNNSEVARRPQPPHR